MPLVGGRLGSYEILAVIGAGGMGQVYRARDLKLNRDVALKILPEAVALDAERLARQRREARVLASLNHPNIAQIYGFEDSGTTHALVLELVEGRTLADRLQRGALPVPEALAIARQIADALEAAHDAGVIHRDLKPANVVLKDDGTVKVLDFGLAKSIAADSDGGAESTMTSPATESSRILGTASYMSPEQARGTPVDKRADVWAFGVLLYELLTGKRMFTGQTTTDVLAAVVRAEPDWHVLPASTPPSIRLLLRRCVEKDLKKRLPHIGVARLEIDEALVAPATVDSPGRTRVRNLIPWLIAIPALGALAVLSWYGLRAPPEILWTGSQLTDPFLFAGCPRISPDGQFLAFCATVDGHSQAGVMNPETGNWTMLTHDTLHGFILDECWSRDSAKLYLSRSDGAHFSVFSVPVLGGDERLVLENALFPELLPDGSLVFQRANDHGQPQLYRFWPDAGRVASLKALPKPLSGSPSFRVTPDGRHVVFFGKPADQSTGVDHVYALDVDSDAATRLALDVPFAIDDFLPMATSADSRSALVALAAGNVYRIVSIPLNGRQTPHTVVTVTNQITRLDVGSDGSLFLDQWDRSIERLRVSPDGGSPERIDTTFIFSGPVPQVLPLPDGRLLMSSQIGGRNHLLLESRGAAPSPFLDTVEQAGTPMTVLGKTHVAFMIGTGNERTIGLASLSDRTISRRLTGAKGAAVGSMAASPDGRTIYYSASDSIWAISTDDGPPRRLRAGYAVTISPNGEELIVRTADANGRPQLVRAPVAGGPDRPVVLDGNWQVSPVDFGPNAVDRNGRVVTNVMPPHSTQSFLWPLAVIDPHTGHVQVIPIGLDAQTSGAWDADGRIVLSAVAYHGSVWRFRPAAPASTH